MSELDDFARATVTPMLRPQEVILSVGWMAPGSRRWRDESERYLAVATTQRLVVITSRQSLMYAVPRPENHGVTIYEYVALASARMGGLGPLTGALLLEHAGQKAQYAVPSLEIVGAKSVEGHADFVGTFLPWIARHAAAGALRTPEGVHAAAAEWWQRPQLALANERWLVANGRSTARTRWVKWPLALSGLCLALAAAGMAFREDGRRQVGYAQSGMAFARQVVAEGKAEFRLEDKLAEGQRAIDRAEAKQLQGTLMVGGGLAGIPGFFVLAVVLTRRRRAAARAWAAQPAAVTAPGGAALPA